MSHTKTLVLGFFAATLFAAGASAAVTQNNVQSFEAQSIAVQNPGAGVDRLKCGFGKNQGIMKSELPRFCTNR